jgi:hypothetical protein
VRKLLQHSSQRIDASCAVQVAFRGKIMNVDDSVIIFLLRGCILTWTADARHVFEPAA